MSWILWWSFCLPPNTCIRKSCVYSTKYKFTLICCLVQFLEKVWSMEDWGTSNTYNSYGSLTYHPPSQPKDSNNINFKISNTKHDQQAWVKWSFTKDKLVSTWSILETKSLSPLASSPVLICVHHSNEDLDTALSLTFNDQSTGTGLEEGGSSFFDLTGFGDSSYQIHINFILFQ